MFTGISSIGDRTIKGLLSDFRSGDQAFDEGSKNYTVNSVGKRLLSFLRKHYDAHYGDTPAQARPTLEVILAGYGKSSTHPSVVKLTVDDGDSEPRKQEPFWPVFGGQSREIERIVWGIDWESFVRIEERHEKLMKDYAAQVLGDHGIEADAQSLPGIEEVKKIFVPDFRIPGVRANWKDFSEQNAIDCVGYFIRIMRGAQRFSSRMPTVGGDIQIALVDKDLGFRFISRREYSHEGHQVPRDTRAQ